MTLDNLVARYFLIETIVLPHGSIHSIVVALSAGSGDYRSLSQAIDPKYSPSSTNGVFFLVSLYFHSSYLSNLTCLLSQAVPSCPKLWKICPPLLRISFCFSSLCTSFSIRKFLVQWRTLLP